MQRLRRLETGKWPYAAGSTGAYRGLLRQKYPCWDATGPARYLFTTEIAHGIKSLLRNNLPESNSFMTFTLFMVGKVYQRTKPTIMVVSDDKPRRKEAFAKIKGSKILARYPGFEVGHCEVAAEHEDLHLLGTSNLRQVGNEDYHRYRLPKYSPADDGPIPPAYACADSIGSGPGWEFHKPTSIHFRDGLDLHTSSVTSGGLFILNRSYYIITTAHVLRSPQSPGLSNDRTIDDSGVESDDCEITGLDDWDSDIDDEMLSSVTSYASMTPSSAGSDNQERLEGPNPPHESSASITSVPGDTAEQKPVIDRVAAVDRLDIDHLDTIGPVMFINRELDLVLVQVKFINRARIEKDANLSIDIKPLQPQYFFGQGLLGQEASTGSPITVLTVSKGPISGKQSSMPFYTRLPGAHGFHVLQSFHLESPLSAGDSGSWVIGGPQKELIGFVVAGSPKTNICLVCPANRAMDSFASLLQQYVSAGRPAWRHANPVDDQREWPGDLVEHSWQQPWSDEASFQKQKQGAQDGLPNGSPTGDIVELSTGLQSQHQGDGDVMDTD
ncbi:zinc finger transcription factor ace1 [Apiospora sp. TS-2023a]